MSPATVPTLQDRAGQLAPLGWTARDAEWLALVALHSGAFARAHGRHALLPAHPQPAPPADLLRRPGPRPRRPRGGRASPCRRGSSSSLVTFRAARRRLRSRPLQQGRSEPTASLRPSRLPGSEGRPSSRCGRTGHPRKPNSPRSRLQRTSEPRSGRIDGFQHVSHNGSHRPPRGRPGWPHFMHVCPLIRSTSSHTPRRNAVRPTWWMTSTPRRCLICVIRIG